jgi:hypothetical protein
MANLQYNNVLAGPRNFIIGSNLTSFFAIGDFMKQNDFYAIAYFKSNGSFVIDANVYSSDGKLIVSVKDMKPEVKGENLQQLNTVDKGDFHSLEIVDCNGTKVLYAETTFLKIPIAVDKFKKGPSIVEINGELYDKSKQLIATGTKKGLIVHRGKCVMGAIKSGALGIVMNCSSDELEFIKKFAKEHLP